MKKFYMSSFFLVILAFGLVGTASAQKNELTSDEVILLANNAETRLSSMAYRAVQTTEWFKERGGDLTIRDTYSFESLPSGRYHWTLEGPAGKLEAIVVDGKNFRRMGDNPWEMLPSRAAKSGNAGVPFVPAISTAGRVGKFINRAAVNGQDVSVYEVRRAASGKPVDEPARTEAIYYMIRDDGMLAAKIVQIDVLADKRFMQSVTNYAYGAEFRIDEPIVDAPKTENN